MNKIQLGAFLILGTMLALSLFINMGAVVLSLIVAYYTITFIFSLFEKEQPLFFDEMEEQSVSSLRETKRRYLQSEEWKIKKQLIHNKYKCCAVCGLAYNLEVHHLTYKNFGAERLEDLTLLCRIHHQARHDEYGYPETLDDYKNGKY